MVLLLVTVFRCFATKYLRLLMRNFMLTFGWSFSGDVARADIVWHICPDCVCHRQRLRAKWQDLIQTSLLSSERLLH